MVKQTGLEVKEADKGQGKLSFVCLLQEMIEQNAATYTKANITHNIRAIQ